MSKITNRMGIPQPLVDAVANDGYSKGDADISATGLLRPPRIAVLEKQYADDITEDASDRIWSLMGQVVHGILERADTTGVAERRLSIQVEGWTVSGQMDRYINGELEDYKVVTAYKFKDGSVPEEYEQQLNIYAVILRESGFPVTKAKIVGILRDWSKLEARRDPEYPQAQIVIRELSLWPPEVAKRFLRERVVLHQQARVQLPACTDEERWARPSKWALMKKGGVRAVKLYDNEADAVAHAATDPKLLSVEPRPGENVRCENYCAVSRMCSQFQWLKSQTAQGSQKEKATA
jgi:hypothetical protein